MKISKSFLILFAVILLATSAMVATALEGSFRPSTTDRFSSSGRSSGFTTSNNYRPNFQTYYSGTDLQRFWPILDNPESCEARQDILLQVSPAGCSPLIVRSDLLADQDVPVFCQIDALKINPLLDIREIRNIRFNGDYPSEISGIGFHPARAALRTNDRVLGSPLISNIGYVVVILKRNENESSLPDSVSINLSAQLDYSSGNAFGVGKAEYRLKEQSDSEFANKANRQTFWNGKYSVKAEEIEEDFARVSIYSGDTKVATKSVEKGKTSSAIYVPESYCQASLEIEYDGFEGDRKKARIEVIDDRGTDLVEVFEGGRFLNGKCVVRDIDVNPDGVTGNVSLSCGSASLVLSLAPRKGELSDATLSKEGDKAFRNAVEAYEKVADDFPFERSGGVGLQSLETYGEIALMKAINLAKENKKFATQSRLINKFLERYPDSALGEGYSRDLTDLGFIDYSNALGAVDIDNGVRSIRLASLSRPSRKSSAVFDFGIDRGVRIEVGERFPAGAKKDYIEVFSIGPNSASIKSDCSDLSSRNLRVGEGTTVCGQPLVLNSVDVEKVAKVKILPRARGTRTETNLSVTLGIEKRAIELSPKKTAKRVERLNKTVEKWERISENLGKTVESLKTACFATSAVLTFKNLVSGFSGEMLARQFVMTGANGWTTKCSQLVASGAYTNPNQCFLANRAEIEKDVSNTQKAIKKVNSDIGSIQSRNSVSSGILGEKSIKVEESKRELADLLIGKFGSVEIDMPDGKTWGTTGANKVSVKQILDSENLESINYEELRNLYMNLERKNNAGFSSVTTESVTSTLSLDAGRINDNVLKRASFKKAEAKTSQGLAVPGSLPDENRNKIALSVVSKEGVRANVPFGQKITHTATLGGVPAVAGFAAGTYVVGLVEGKSKEYVVREVFLDNEDGTYTKLSDADARKFVSKKGYNIGVIEGLDSNSYNNKYRNPKVRYYESEPYKGMPAIVPLDKERGWYAATRQKIPTFGGIGAFDKSGRVVSFYLCNVGRDGIEEFVQGNDICTLVNLNTGQPLEFVPGLSKDDARRLVGDAQRAISEAANQHGGKTVRIFNELYDVGTPAANLPSTQCQNFMSARECQLLFNVCDPVICPSSRCDLGGKYPVANVVQTGVVGSLVLCLPNIREGVFLPVCLTGVQAGVDAYTSVLKGSRDCLQESLDTGRTVGSCDQITSVYTCQLFWEQVAPIANVLIPKLIGSAFGQGARGGGEYLTVTSAWENTRQSVQTFTQSYGVNVLDVFRARAAEQIGGEFCKAFISTSVPTSFKEAVKPESPPQFYAWFSTFKFSDATIPATAQYKVFYHVFSGNDDGVFYSVYLKEPPESSFFAVSPTVQVASGFVGKGDFAEDSIDFTAPEGYKQLCVNLNGEEKCGFRRVSTDFALNYLADSYVANQLNRTGIKSEKECISGSRSTGALAAGGFDIASVKEALIPESYNRGVVRICSSENPGVSTDPERFVKVGNCGDENTGCWLDKKSIKDSINDNNKGLQNATINSIQGLQNRQLEAIRSETTGDADAKLDGFENDKNQMKKQSFEERRISSKGIIAEIDLMFSKLVLNSRKARALLLKAELLEFLIPPSVPKEAKNSGKVGSVSGGETAKEPAPTVVPERTEVLILDGVYLPEEGAPKVYVVSGLEKSRIYLSFDKVYFEEKTLGFDFLARDTLVGTINEDGVIRMIRGKDKVEGEGTGLYDKLDGGVVKIGGKEITV